MTLLDTINTSLSLALLELDLTLNPKASTFSVFAAWLFDNKQTFGSGALSQDPNILCPEASHTMSHQVYGIYYDDIIIIISSSTTTKTKSWVCSLSWTGKEILLLHSKWIRTSLLQERCSWHHAEIDMIKKEIYLCTITLVSYLQRLHAHVNRHQQQLAASMVI